MPSTGNTTNGGKIQLHKLTHLKHLKILSHTTLRVTATRFILGIQVCSIPSKENCHLAGGKIARREFQTYLLGWFYARQPKVWMDDRMMHKWINLVLISPKIQGIIKLCPFWSWILTTYTWWSLSSTAFGHWESRLSTFWVAANICVSWLMLVFDQKRDDGAMGGLDVQVQWWWSSC